MNSIHISYSDGIGGASRAAYRIFSAIEKESFNQGYSSIFKVYKKVTGDYRVIDNNNEWKYWKKIQPLLSRIPYQSFKTTNNTAHSTALIPNNFYSKLRDLNKSSKVDLCHLHWIGDSTLTIEEIGKIDIPVVWSLHDQWPFCGAEHYCFPPKDTMAESDDIRYINGYQKESRNIGEGGFDLNRWTWLRKLRAWKKPLNIVCSSSWLYDCAKNSFLMRDWPIYKIPYPIDLEKWKPVDKRLARDLLNLSNKDNDIPIILFGAVGGTIDPRKGADLLFEAFLYLKNNSENNIFKNMQLIIFGEYEPINPPKIGYPIKYVGKLNDDISLRLLYSAADLMVVPSRQEAFGQTASEAHACGTPVASFEIGGLKDIVDHKKTGYLAKPFSSKSLAMGIKYILESSKKNNTLGSNAREKALRLWDKQKIASSYIQIYRNLCNKE